MSESRDTEAAVTKHTHLCLDEACAQITPKGALFCSAHNTPANREFLRELINDWAEALDSTDDLEDARDMLHARVVFLEEALLKAVRALSEKNHKLAHSDLLAALHKN